MQGWSKQPGIGHDKRGGGAPHACIRASAPLESHPPAAKGKEGTNERCRVRPWEDDAHPRSSSGETDELATGSLGLSHTHLSDRKVAVEEQQVQLLLVLDSSYDGNKCNWSCSCSCLH